MNMNMNMNKNMVIQYIVDVAYTRYVNKYVNII